MLLTVDRHVFVKIKGCFIWYVIILCRGKMVGAVQDIVIVDMLGRKLSFVLHSDGIFRVWDLCHRSKLMNHTVRAPSSAGNYHILFLTASESHEPPNSISF